MAVALVVLAGCADARPAADQRLRSDLTGGASTPPTVAPDNPVPGETPHLPSALVGQWALSGPGVAPGLTINLGYGVDFGGGLRRPLSVFDHCRTFHGTWDARKGGEFLDGAWDARPGGAFLADLGKAQSGDCTGEPPFTVGTVVLPMRAATTFVVDGERRRLLDDAGTEVLVLTPRASSTAPANVGGSEAEVPRLRDDGNILNAGPVSLPPEVRPARRDDLVGSWTPVGFRGPDGPVIRFEEDGFYDTEICSQLGRWSVSGTALLMARHLTGGLVVCEYLDPFEKAAAIGVYGKDLVLVTAYGEWIHRLQRVHEPDQLPSIFPP